MGKVNQLRIGTAATVAEAEDFEPSAMDIDDRCHTMYVFDSRTWNKPT